MTLPFSAPRTSYQQDQAIPATPRERRSAGGMAATNPAGGATILRLPVAAPRGRYQPLSARHRLSGIVLAGLVPLAGATLLLLRFQDAPPPPVPAAPLVVSLLPEAAPPEPVRDRAPGPLQTVHARVQPQPRIDPIPPAPVVVNPVPVALAPPTPPAPDPGPPAPATTAPVSQPAPPAPQAGGRDTSFEARLLRHIQKFRRYPAAARRMRDQGVAHLRIRMDRAGRILAAELIRSSGSAALDRGALDTLRRAAPLPRIPEDRPDILELVLPVEFFLE
jgi:periplasmic protein TonB